jgi:hypothetical protein
MRTGSKSSGRSRWSRSEPEFKDYLVPLEEFRISTWDAIAISTMRHCPRHAKTLSELVEMGFDKDDVENLRATMQRR